MTIELPIPSTDLISQIENVTIEVNQAEATAVRAIRERFAPYARHNGYIKTGRYAANHNNYSVARDAFYYRKGKRVHGLLALDNWTDDHVDQNRGGLAGERLYLLETGEWLLLERTGSWSHWQGEPDFWYTDPESAEQIEVSDNYGTPEEADSGTSTHTDEEVAARYDLDDILSELGKSMTEMVKKLPERYNKLKARAELAQRIIAGAQEVK